MRGEFRFGSGLVLPNSVTLTGRTEYLKMIFRGVDTTQLIGGANMYIGLCAAVPADSLTLADLVEPSAAGGYARKAVTRNALGWPNAGLDAGEPYLETGDLVFAPSAPYSAGITRLFLTPQASASIGEVWALSAALPSALALDAATPLAYRTFRYRVYMR